MKYISCNCEDLLKPVKTVEGIVEKRQTHPILSNILIEQENEHVKFSTTDLDVQICTDAPVGVSDTSSRFTVSANNKAEFTSKDVYLPHYFMKGATYSLDAPAAYGYNENGAQQDEVVGEVQIDGKDYVAFDPTSFTAMWKLRTLE